MTDAMSVAELSKHQVELLPARTVLSMWQADATGAIGAPGTHGTNGRSISEFFFFGIIGYGGSDPSPSPSTS